MKKIALILISITAFSIILKAQEDEKFKIIAGVRVNPFVMYDFEGNRAEITRIHGELGALFNKRIYTSVGYTPFANAIYNFNEYWFIGFDKKIPVSWVLAEEYMIDNNKFIFQTGPNIKLSKIGNVYMFLFTQADNFDLGLKVGVFIPLNFVIKQKLK